MCDISHQTTKTVKILSYFHHNQNLIKAGKIKWIHVEESDLDVL